MEKRPGVIDEVSSRGLTLKGEKKYFDKCVKFK